MFCKKCNKEIEKKNAGGHARWCGKKKKLLKQECKTCSKEIISKRPKKYCSQECRSKGLYTKEFKAKISVGRKKFLKENPEKHPWKKNNKFLSKPCETFKKHLRNNNVKFLEEYQPLDERFFSIDVAIPEIKLGFEINGEQHYNRDKTLKKYYQERHDAIIKQGWKLYELHYSIVYDEEKVKEIIHSIKKNYNLDGIKIDFQLRKTKKEKKLEERAKHLKEKKNKSEEITSYRVNYILNAKRDYWGWVRDVSNDLGISHTHVRRLIKKHIPEIL
jgi:very-short-patch-repair endonuclease